MVSGANQWSWLMIYALDLFNNPALALNIGRFLAHLIQATIKTAYTS
jgi:hypothetical protein